jgi:hypothetical protein
MEFRKLFVLFAVILAVSGMAMAIRAAAADGASANLVRWEAATSSVNITTEGGNISTQNLTGSGLTDKWAGFFGNISGVTLYLTDNASGTTNYLYHWTVAGGSEQGEVCVSTDASYDFTAPLSGANATDIDTAWAFGGAPDNATNTFNNGTCADIIFEEQGVTVSSAAKAEHERLSTFATCAINNSAVAAGDVNELAYCTLINITNGLNYYGTGTDYELIVPTNDTNPTSTTQYFFFIEIN